MDSELSFVGVTSTSRSVNFDARRMVNWFAHSSLEGSRTKLLAMPTPGLSLAVDLSGSAMRGLFQFNNVLYAVKDNKLYSINTSFTATERGTLNTSTGIVHMACNGTEVLIVDGTTGYIFTILSAGFAQISDPDFPANPITCAYQDGYFFVNTTQYTYASDLLAGTVWNALSFASAESDPDALVAIASDHRELILFGKNTTEFFYNNGASPFPFTRNTGAFLQKGCLAPHSIAQGDNSLFWLSSSPQGEGLVMKLEGYSPVVVSTPEIGEAIARFTTKDDAIGYVYMEGGHEFYRLTFPTANVTYVYDSTMSAIVGQAMWHEASSFNIGRHIANCYAFFNGNHIIGDYASGKLYKMSQDYLDDDGTIIQRYIVCQHQHVSGLLLFIDELEILMECGVGNQTGSYTEPLITLEISRDGGHVWGSYGTVPIGKVGEYRQRVVYRRMGRCRDVLFRLTLSAPVRAYVMGARARFRTGTY
jgi:hypothetical protein